MGTERGAYADAFADLGFQVNYPLPPSATRDYNPALGRWMVPDPLGRDMTKSQSLNPYGRACPERSRRVTNNPASMNDPSSLSGDSRTDLERRRNPIASILSPSRSLTSQ